MKLRKKICVFCGSKRDTPKEYVELAHQFGEELARQEVDLVWGGCDLASMGALGRSVQAQGGRVIGVIPRSMKERGLAYEAADELVIVGDLAERKRRMKELSDAFVVLPGGVGTVDEFISQLSDTIVEIKAGILPKKIAVLNWKGFYDDLVYLLEGLYRRGVSDASYRNLYRILPDTESVFKYLK